MLNEKNVSEQMWFQKMKTLLAILLGLNVAGWANAFYALWHRQNLFVNGLSEKSFCNVNDFIDCDSVAFSKFSAFLNFPVAAWGMLFYAVTIFLALSMYFALQDARKESALKKVKIFFYSQIASLVVTLLLAGISLFKLNTLCIICLVTYLINIGIFLVTLKLNSVASTDSKSDQLLIPQVGGMFIGGIALILGLHLLMPTLVTTMANKSQLDESVINGVMQKFLSQQPFAFSLDQGPSFGPKDAPIVVVEFSDYQCPYCALSARTIPTLIKAYGDKVRYVYKFYPLDSACNPKMDRAAHPLACRAAKVSYCLFKEKGSDAFYKFKSETFEKQADMTPESLVASAKGLGANEETLKKCLDDASTHQYVLDNVNEGVSAKVEGTPAIYVNGRIVETGPNPQVLVRVFDAVLKSLGQN